MNVKGYLNINRRGICRFTKNKPGLNWDEISMELKLKIPDKLFSRPTISAKLEISDEVIPKEQPIQKIINTKELIEQSTGAKIEFEIVKSKGDKK